MRPIIEVSDVWKSFGSHEVLRGVNLSVQDGETMVVLGASGCGKSVTSLSIMRLIREPGRIVGGHVVLHDDDGPRDLLALPEQAMEHVRGNQISMIFQDPMTSLNPVLTIGYQLMEPLKIHLKMSSAEARELSDRLAAARTSASPTFQISPAPSVSKMSPSRIARRASLVSSTAAMSRPAGAVTTWRGCRRPWASPS